MIDVAVIGGGIAGCAVAAFLAEGGARVRLYEREAVGAGASGRNSGVLQHPMDPALEGLYRESLELHAELGDPFRADPVGALVVSDDAAALAGDHAAAAARFPALAPTWLGEEDLRAAEPGLADGLVAYRLDTGRPVPPAAATRAWAARARAAGAELVIGAEARLAPGGVAVDGRPVAAGAVVAAAGPWTAELLPGLPVRPVWGVVAQVRLPAPPRHCLESTGIEALTAPGGELSESLFSLVTAAGVSAVGSTFTTARPDPEAVAPRVLARAARYVPALADAGIEAVRACARPVSGDGRPYLGPVPGHDGLHLLTGHGAWGITLGPASARLVARTILEPGPPRVPSELAAGRALRATADGD